VLYCARQTKKITKGTGQVTIFLALGKLSLENGLPKVADLSCQNLISGDALLVGNQAEHILEENSGGGLALVSDWRT
jgi:hypothetical protein